MNKKTSWIYLAILVLGMTLSLSESADAEKIRKTEQNQSQIIMEEKIKLSNVTGKVITDERIIENAVPLKDALGKLSISQEDLPGTKCYIKYPGPPPQLTEIPCDEIVIVNEKDD